MRDLGTLVFRFSPVSQTTVMMEVMIPPAEMTRRYTEAHENDTPLEIAFPELSDDTIGYLKTGVLPHEWDEFFNTQ